MKKPLPHEICCLQDASHTVGIAADHGGFELKEYLTKMLREAGAEVVDFGDCQLKPEDDYPDFVVPLALAVASGEVERGIAICGSGVGACIAANKVPDVRACLIHDPFSAHQGVEDDDLNLICLGGLVVGKALAWELVRSFLCSRFSGKERYQRRLGKVKSLEHQPPVKSISTNNRAEKMRRTVSKSLKLHLFRHGETEWSITGQHTGQTDLPLTSQGEENAGEMGHAVKDVYFSKVLTSPLKRAWKTCELADLESSPKIDEDLVEWNYGDYEGKRTVDIWNKNPEWNLFRDGCPNGESPEQVLDRADRLIARLCMLEGNVALFSHGQFGALLAARWVGMPVDAAQHFQLSTASHSILSIDPHHSEVAIIELWNKALCTSERKLLKRSSIENWENEGGEISDEELPQD
ncbi:MAG: RpiB/LacA/LacB family sugar-phosphate isomerase [Cryomorphaceae bacterium]|jgi:RpiB/LacA/LacB family sugar-phosphate isomerase